MGWVLVLLAAPVLADNKPKTHAEHAEMSDGHDKGAHQHGEMVRVPSGPTVPDLDFVIAMDAVSGWNLHIQASNFRFAPESVNRPHKDGESHAHVYINGVKLARIHGPWFHIGALAKGQNRLPLPSMRTTIASWP